ncbi:recombination-associated protein RdgC [Pasteurellaceae bacterium HPA106]|uniref:recombination-associated protein RdgC n=1 Tax=Spirabiliibacterium pneumoniae TaxID=221400 RepID=UPI001AAD9632|nr:recombination-associated protein RdgC [Spirabiliibacterium pneumoniae]MBE2897066.1 recombination-associated protein RdgC [Spirabiliibacterium pneumoniae]
MQWFKNVMIYRLSKEIDLSAQTVGKALLSQAFHPCGKHDVSHFGWLAPLTGSDELLFAHVGRLFLLAQKEEKILPTAVVKKAFEERLFVREDQEQRKLSKVEKQALKDDVVHELLPQAFSKHQQTALFIDPASGLIFINAASATRAEATLALLRKSLGSLPVVPLTFVADLSAVMTDWIAHDTLPEWLNTLGEAELVSSRDESVIRCKQQALDSDEMHAHFDAGKQVSKLALEWEERLSAVLASDTSLKRVKFSDSLREQNDDIVKEDVQQRFEADFLLMSDTLLSFVQKLANDFGGIPES